MAAQSSPNPYALVIADLKAKRDELDRLIQSLERHGSAPSQGAAPPVDDPVGASDLGGGDAGDLAGAFLGMSIADAAKKLLEKRRRAMKLSDVVDELRKGGLPMQGKDPSAVVTTVLKRRAANVGDVVRVKAGEWGLKEWYPNRVFKTKLSADRDPSSSNEQ